MKSFAENGVTGISYLDTRREKKDGTFPVKFRITFQRKTVLYRARVDLTMEEWQSVTDPSHPKYNTLFAKRKRKDIDKGLELIEAHVIEIPDFSFDRLNNRMGKNQKSDIFKTFDEIIQEKLEARKYNTSDWYKYSKRIIEKYVAGSTLFFKDIDVDWLKRFEEFLINEGKSVTTISMYLRALQTVINRGIKDHYISKNAYPFGSGPGKYRIPKEIKRNKALNLDQIKKILEYEPMSDNEHFLRDIWIFSYLCNGINLGDLLRLKYSNIVGREIAFDRQKTIHKQDRSKISAIILPHMEEIIARWGNENKPENYIFPILKHGLNPKQQLLATKNFTSLLNKRLTRIGKHLGIGSITSYTARHSFATVTKRSGASIEYISESLGHSDFKVTKNYLAQFEIETRLKNAENLLKFNTDETT